MANDLQVVESNLPATVEAADAFGAFAGAGFENVTNGDKGISRLVLLQPLSPQVIFGDAKHVPNAKLGDIFDPSTGEVIPAPVTFLPVFYKREWLEWAPKETGKGLIEVHSTADIMRHTRPNEKNKPILDNGNMIVETAQWYGLNLSANDRPSLIGFTSTQHRKSRQWMALADGETIQGTNKKAPLFYRTWLLGSAIERKQSYTWAGWTIARGKLLQEARTDWLAVLKRAVEFKESVSSGTVQADMSGMDDEGVGAAPSGPGGGRTDPHDDGIPF